MHKTVLCILAANFGLVSLANEPAAASLRVSQKLPKLAVETGLTLEIPLTLSLNADSSNRMFTVDTSFKNYDGRVVSKLNTKTISLSNSKDVDFKIFFTPPENGWYQASVEVKDVKGERVANRSIGLAAVPVPRDVDADKSIFGMNVQMTQGQGDAITLPYMLRLAGIRWIREVLYWGGVEKRAGKYEIDPVMKTFFRLLNEQGISVLSVIGFGCEFHNFKTKEGAEAFGRMAEFVAKDMKGICDHFELWNEPNGFGNITADEYVPLLAYGADGVHKGNPKAVAIGCGGAEPGGWSSHYLAAIEKNNFMGKMDTFSIHPYLGGSPEIGYLAVGAAAPLVNLVEGSSFVGGAPLTIGLCRNLPKPVKVWVTEMGWPTHDISLDDQAQAVSRMYLIGAVHSDFYERIFLYNFVCNGENAKEMQHNFGILNNNFSVRPSFVAIAATAQAIDGKPFLKSLKHSDASVQTHLFGTKENPTLTAWVTELSRDEAISGKMADGSPSAPYFKLGSTPKKKIMVSLSVPDNSDTIIVRDWQWRNLKIKPERGVLHLTLTNWPLYVEGLKDTSQISFVN